MSRFLTRRRLTFAAILGIGFILIMVELYFLSPSVRTIVVAGAEWVGADEFLIGRLADHDLKVRADAGEALVRRGGKAVPDLIASLSDPEAENRRSAAAILARIGPAATEAIPALLRVAVEDEDEGTLETAGQAWGIVARDQPGPVQEILTLLESPSDSSKLAAIRAAACLGDPRAVPPLIVSLKHANPKVREEAAEALGDLGTMAAQGLPALIEALADPEPEVRSEAREAITKMIKGGPTSLSPELYSRSASALEKAQAELRARQLPPGPR